MIRFIHLNNDLKQIMRDPIMAILMVGPLFLIIALKLMVLFLIPIIRTSIGFDVSPYLDYVFVFVVMMCGAMMGIVTGFMMIDDRDGKIAELMSVTPLGRSGYLFNRLLFAATLSVLYSILSYYVLNVVELPLITMLFVSLLSSNYAIIIGLLIFTFADDKVKGLTFAKAINSLSLFAFTDLLALKWLTVLSWFFPPYWITKVVQSPHSFLIYVLALLVNFGWLFVLVRHYWKKES
jgi:fluoroquinolone transport system permease protein